MDENKDIIIYQNGEIEINVSVDKDTIWLSSEKIAMLFGVQRPAIVKHINNIYKTNELSKILTCSILEQVTKDGKKRKKNFYNLDVIISVGYRVNSIRATQFRIWATSVLKQYVYKGFVINSEKITHQRFKELENDVSILKNKVTEIDLYLKTNQLLKQGVFFDNQVFDAYIFVSDLIRGANKSIILIDNYIDDTVLTLLSKRKKSVEVVILTKKIGRQLLLDIDKYNAQYEPIKIFKNAHDRFLIIDEKDVYHFGASLKDLGKKWFAFSKMNKNSITIMENIRFIMKHP